MTIFMGFAPPHGFDWFWIALIFVLLFGAKKLPDLARGLGKSLGEFKKAKQEFENELQTSMKEEPKTNTPASAPVPGTVAKDATVIHDSSKNN